VGRQQILHPSYRQPLVGTGADPLDDMVDESDVLQQELGEQHLARVAGGSSEAGAHPETLGVG